jgi:hypothetical protein
MQKTQTSEAFTQSSLKQYESPSMLELQFSTTQQIPISQMAPFPAPFSLEHNLS